MSALYSLPTPCTEHPAPGAMSWAARAGTTATRVLLGVALAFLPACKPAASPPSPGRAELVPAAEQFVDLLVRRDYATAAEQFDAVMTGAMPPAKLAEAWESLPKHWGRFKQRTRAEAVRSSGFDIVVVQCEFELGAVAVRVVFNQDNQVTGLWFAPGEKPAPYEAPAYVKPDAFTAIDVTVGGGDWALAGTLTVPVGDGPFPAVVLVHGSGPHDRDESIGPNKPFRDLGEGLASRGVAVLRYEKRTKAYPEKMVRLQETVTVKEETVEDALAGVALLKRSAQIKANSIFVLGHSLGGMLIPRIGAGDAEIAGFIVMAGTARPLEDVLLDQVEYILSLQTTDASTIEQLTQLKAQVARVKDPTLSPATPASDLPFAIPAGYWLDLRSYRPAEAALSLRQPMLFLLGGRDYQVTEADFDLWKRALGDRPQVQFKLYPALNHLFARGTGKAVPSEYIQPNHVDEEVIQDIVVWVKSAAH